MLNIFKLNLLDRYILKKYIFTTLFFILIFSAISIAIDYSEKTDNFANPKIHGKDILIYFLCFIPHIVSLLLPIFVFISTIFFTSQLAARTEFIPMFCSGIGMRKVLKPYLIGGILFSGLLWVANKNMLPLLNQRKAEFLEKYVDEAPKYTELNRYAIKIDSNKTLDIGNYNTERNIGTKISIYNFSGTKITGVSRADSLIWNEVAQTWELKNIRHREIVTNMHSITELKTLELKTFLTPSDFKYDFYLKEKLTTTKLRKKIEQEKLKGSNQVNIFKIELYKRDATPFSIIILSLISAILSSRKVRGGTGINIAIGFLLSAIYILLDRTSTVFSVNSNLQPMLAAWLPNIIFSIIIIYLYKKSQQ